MMILLFALILPFCESKKVQIERYVSGNNTDEIAAAQYLSDFNIKASEECNRQKNVKWNYQTNINNETKKKLSEISNPFWRKAGENLTSFDWKSFNDSLLRRQFKLLSNLGRDLPEQQLKKLNDLASDAAEIHSTSKICPYNRTVENDKECNLSMKPDIIKIMMESRDYDELLHVWKSWREKVGRPLKKKFVRHVRISNRRARIKGFEDLGDMWREEYESETFQQDISELWEQIRPLYLQLHAYVRKKLISIYGGNKIRSDGPIPSHLLGSMFAEDWRYITNDTIPFPGKPSSINDIPNMIVKNMTALEIVRISEDFFTSLGLKQMTPEFWNNSIFEKPADREIVCHASAWDFCNGNDFRIKLCMGNIIVSFMPVHHEMGHVEYYQHYAHQPYAFRKGAHPAFHEAIGDVMSLSVSTPKHLKTIGLLDEIPEDYEGSINFLYSIALEKVAFLPFAYLVDVWRWKVFSREIKNNVLNRKWWEMRLLYQGICPAIKRSEQDFDPGSQYHIANMRPYAMYFVSYIAQFQFHKSLCEAAGHSGPLHECDIYNSKEAGNVLSKMMELGRSKPWEDAMEVITGGTTRKFDAGPLLEYFEPLYDWLKEQNKNEVIGWRYNDSMVCP